MININLIAERRAKKLREFMILRLSGMGVLVLLIIMVGLNLLAYSLYDANKKDLEQADRELKEAMRKKQEMQITVNKIAELKPVIRLLEQVRASEGAWITILADIGRVIPHDVVLSSFTCNPGKEEMKIRLAGSAKDETTIGNFWVALREGTQWAGLPTLGPVNISEVKEEGSTAVINARGPASFDITVPVMGMIGGDL